ncbi:MAG: hypothetical protein ACKO55_11830, partial [Bacteroidota bacterium]
KAGNKRTPTRLCKLKELFMANGFKKLINANLSFYLLKFWIRFLVEGFIKKMDFIKFTRVHRFGVFFCIEPDLNRSSLQFNLLT